MRDVTPRVVGVSDDAGTVVACSDLSRIGGTLGEIAAPESPETEFTSGEYTLRTLYGPEGNVDYIVFCEGIDELARTLCRFATVAISEVKSRFEENNDRSAFIKSIMSDNVLPGDIYTRAKDLRFSAEAQRACLLIRQSGVPTSDLADVLRDAFPDKQTQFVINMNAYDVVLVTQLHSDAPEEELQKLAESVERRIAEIPGVRYTIGVGTPANTLRELADRFKEAQVAIDVGRVFETDRTLVFYENLGLGRLIYQLPTRMCEMFLSEVFKKNPIEALDQETLYTIYKFFENNLNVSETSRRLFVHRNTLVYRLEKIKKLTGLDLREFDHAIVFKVALMVKRYLGSQEMRFDPSSDGN
jgi:carbohydrate diacid regulator